MFPNNSSKNSAFQSQSVISLPVDSGVFSRFSSVKLWFGEVLLSFERRAVNHICVANLIFFPCFHREHNMIRCQCSRFRNTNVMHCAISHTVLSHLLSFAFKCTASTPLKRENSLCVGAELRTCHLN